MSEQDPSTGAAAPAQPEFSLQRIYVKDLSFEAPHAPQVFTENWQPQINMNLNTQVTNLGNNHVELVLVVSVTAKSGEKVGFHAEVHQGGIFHIQNVPERDMGPLLGIVCPNVLFPYAREAISDLVNRGSFPQLLLAPVNFEALYLHHLQEQRQKAAAAEGQPATVQ